jgi:hypothetical protein
MNTRKRPGIVTCEVRRAPFVPSGSFTTCTRILLAFLQQVLDARLLSRLVLGLRPSAVLRRLRPSCLLLVSAFEALELLQGIDDFGDVEKAVALEPEVDEGGLHAGSTFETRPL